MRDGEEQSPALVKIVHETAVQAAVETLAPSGNDSARRCRAAPWFAPVPGVLND
jgi:hypothetical protein